MWKTFLENSVKNFDEDLRSREIKLQDFILFNSFINNTWLNGVRDILSEENLDSAIENVHQYFLEKKISYSYLLPVFKEPKRLKEKLFAKNFFLEEVFVGMGIEIKNFKISKLFENLEIVVCNSNEDWQSWKKVFEDGFKSSQEISNFLQNSFINNESFISVVGKIDSQIVACATMHLSKDYACLYNIATLKEFQRRKMASTLISHLINIAKNKGYENVILQASKSGLALYEKLGFFKIAPINLYSFKAKI